METTSKPTNPIVLANEIRLIQSQLQTPLLADEKVRGQLVGLLESCLSDRVGPSWTLLRLREVAQCIADKNLPEAVRAIKVFSERVVQFLQADRQPELLKNLPEPKIPRDLDKATALYVQGYWRGQPEEALQDFASWVSQYKVPLLDLLWPTDELLRLVPYLETVNFTQLKLPKEAFIQLIRACTGAKTLIFFGNHLDTEKLESFRGLPLETLDISWCSFDVPGLDLSTLATLKCVKLASCARGFKGDIDLSGAAGLKEFSLISVADFQGKLLFSESVLLEKFCVEDCKFWSQKLKINATELRSFQVHSCELPAQHIDLSAASHLTEVDLSFCKLAGCAVTLPAAGHMKTLNFDDCQQFEPAADWGDFSGHPGLEEVNFACCKLLNIPLKFGYNPNLRKLNMNSCVIYNQEIPWETIPNVKASLYSCRAMTYPKERPAEK